MNKPVILIIGTDNAFTQNLLACGTISNSKVLTTNDTAMGKKIVDSNSPILLIAVLTKNTDCNQLLGYFTDLKRINEDVQIIVVAGDCRKEFIVDAFRAGVQDFFTSPHDYPAIANRVVALLQLPGISPVCVGGPAPKTGNSPAIIGGGRSMRDVREVIAKVAPMATTVFITGETGTGKGLAAYLIHTMSNRRANPFITVNCAALPDSLVESELFGYERGAFTGAEQSKPGRFEMAHRGTLFLDEIGDMGSQAQAKILKVLEDKEIVRLGGKSQIPLDLRLIAATNLKSQDLLDGKRFRLDLYYRINVTHLHLPPLRDRKEDIPRLVAHSLDMLNRKYGKAVHLVEENVMKCLLAYNWPGNVRELKNVIENAYVFSSSEEITLKDLPEKLKQNQQVSARCFDEEKDRIISMLESTNWNKTQAAIKMKCSRMTLYRKMSKYNLAS